MDVKFPDVEVQLVGQDGNAFAILNEYMNEAMSGDYDHLLAVTARTVAVY